MRAPRGSIRDPQLSPMGPVVAYEEYLRPRWPGWIVVLDHPRRACVLRIDGSGSARVRQRDGEILVALRERIALHIDGDGLAGVARIERHRAAREQAAGEIGAIGGRVCAGAGCPGHARRATG